MNKTLTMADSLKYFVEDEWTLEKLAEFKERLKYISSYQYKYWKKQDNRFYSHPRKVTEISTASTNSKGSIEYSVISNELGPYNKNRRRFENQKNVGVSIHLSHCGVDLKSPDNSALSTSATKIDEDTLRSAENRQLRTCSFQFLVPKNAALLRPATT